METNPLTSSATFGYMTISEEKNSSTKLKPLIYAMDAVNTTSANEYYDSTSSITIPRTASISTAITTMPCKEMSSKEYENTTIMKEIQPAVVSKSSALNDEKPQQQSLTVSFDEQRVKANHIMEYQPIETANHKDNVTTTSASTAGSSSSTYIINGGRWTRQEHENFLIGLTLYGREWKKVAQKIKTRTSAQIRSHAQKYFAKLAKESNADKKNNENHSGNSNRVDMKTKIYPNDGSLRTQNGQKYQHIKMNSFSSKNLSSSAAADTIRSISLLSKSNATVVPSDIELVGQMRIYGNAEKKIEMKQKHMQKRQDSRHGSLMTHANRQESECYKRTTPRFNSQFKFGREERIKVSHLREEEMCAIEVLLGYMSQTKRPRRCNDEVEDNRIEGETTNKESTNKDFTKFKGRNFIPIQSYKMSIPSKSNDANGDNSMYQECEINTTMTHPFRDHTVKISPNKQCQIESTKDMVNSTPLHVTAMSAVTTANQ